MPRPLANESRALFHQMLELTLAISEIAGAQRGDLRAPGSASALKLVVIDDLFHQPHLKRLLGGVAPRGARVLARSADLHRHHVRGPGDRCTADSRAGLAERRRARGDRQVARHHELVRRRPRRRR